MRIRANRQILALLLVLTLLLGNFGALPVAAATEDYKYTGGEVTAFAPLAEDVAAQSVAAAEDAEAPVLPGSLAATATVTPLAAKPMDGEPTAQPEPISAEVDIQVREWVCEPAFDSMLPGDYSFTPLLQDGWTLAEGTEAPAIVVTVTQPEPAGAEPGVAISIEQGELGDTALRIVQGEPVTDADLLVGVCAVDETGADVPVAVKDVDGLDLADPQPKGTPDEPEPYIITCAAAHPVTGEETTAQRECYITLGRNGITLLASTKTFDLSTGTWSDGTPLPTDADAGAANPNKCWLENNTYLHVLDGADITVTGTSTASSYGGYGVRRIVAASGARVKITLRDANITCTDDHQSPILLESGADATIALSGTNILKAGRYRAGIGATDATLTIDGVGSLEATGGYFGAGIGGGDAGDGGDGGNVTIKGGTVTAIGGSWGAGIGGGSVGAGDTVTISGGTVEAFGGLGGAGIGGGGEGAGGTVTIKGGNVTAKGGRNGASIGGGDGGNGGTVTISGGSVTADSSDMGAGIGGGRNGDGGTVTISGGSVTADSGDMGAGIGGGRNGDGGAVTITGGTVKAFSGASPGSGMAIGQGDGGYSAGTLAVDYSPGVYTWLYNTTNSELGASPGKGALNTATNLASYQYLSVDAGIPVTSITVRGAGDAAAITTKGGTLQMSAAVLPDNATNKSVTWSVSDITGGAAITENGLLTATVNGTVTVKATANDGSGVFGTREITISGQPVSRNTFDLSTGRWSDGSRLPTNAGAGVTSPYKCWLENNTYLHVLDGADITVTGTSAASSYGGDGVRRIVAASGARVKITLRDANITCTDDHQSPILLESGANAAIALAGTNILKAGLNRAGIGATGATLTIDGEGSLTVTGGSSGAGIGGDEMGAGGNVTIKGGIVTATGGDYGAGIGGGAVGAGGSVTIIDGIVTASGGTNSAGIGGGNYGAGGNVTISGGAVEAIAGDGTSAVKPMAIGKGTDGGGAGTLIVNYFPRGYTWHYNTTNSGSGASIGTGALNTTANLPSYRYLKVTHMSIASTNIFDLSTGTWSDDTSLPTDAAGGAADPNKCWLENDTYLHVLDGAAITVTGKSAAGSGNDGVRRIVVPSGARATITLRDARIICTDDYQCPVLLEPGARATIALSGTNILQAGSFRAGIGATGATLTIDGEGSLAAIGGNSAAGIGGGEKGAGGNVIIIDGTVTATGGAGGAGIGSGYMGAGYTVTVSGGTVTAAGGTASAGIGSGYMGAGGTVTISGGTVIATGGAGGIGGSSSLGGAGIGGGGNSAGGTVTINGGTVTATGASHGAGIGGGNEGAGGIVTINGGNVTAAGGWLGAGIGGGEKGAGGNVIISGDTVEAIAGYSDGAAKSMAIGQGAGGGGAGTLTVFRLPGDYTWLYNTQNSGAGAATGNGKLSTEANLTSYQYLKIMTVAMNMNIFNLATGTWSDGTSLPTDAIDGAANPNKCWLENDTYLHVLDGADIMVGGTSAAGCGDGVRRIIVASGARVKITLWDAAIICTGDDQSPILLEPGANATIALSGTNILQAGFNRAGIGTTGATLTIDGEGSLEATGGWLGAGIGGRRNGDGGTVTIKGGNVTATSSGDGGNGGAGIGGGYAGNGGTVTISGGNVTAKGGATGAGIGGGGHGDGGNVIISGGTVEAMAGDYIDTGYPMAIGRGVFGNSFGKLTVDGYPSDFIWLYNTQNNGAGALPGSGELNTEANLISYRYLKIIPMSTNIFNLATGKWLDGTALPTDAAGGAGHPNRCWLENDTYLHVLNGADITVTGTSAAGRGGDGVRRIVAASGAKAHITLRDATITCTGDNQSPILLEPGANAAITLSGANILKAGGIRAGIGTTGATLTLDGGGSLAATGGQYGGAGIGGDYRGDGGTVAITDGTVTAKGGDNGAGIGGGQYGAGGNVTIRGGIVEATGGINGMALGKGFEGSSVGALTVDYFPDGYAWRYNTTDNGSGAYLGSGALNAEVMGAAAPVYRYLKITRKLLTDTTIFDLSTGKWTDGTALPTDAASGAAHSKKCWLEKNTYLWVTDGADITVTGTSAAGNDGVRRIVVPSGARVKITLRDATIICTGGNQSPILLESGANAAITLKDTNSLMAGLNRAGIGTTDATLTLDGDGSLEVIGGKTGAGIGGGWHGNGGTITINGGNITAKGGDSGAGIGGGSSGAGGNVTISGGMVEAIGGDKANADRPMAIGKGSLADNAGTLTVNYTQGGYKWLYNTQNREAGALSGSGKLSTEANLTTYQYLKIIPRPVAGTTIFDLSTGTWSDGTFLPTDADTGADDPNKCWLENDTYLHVTDGADITITGTSAAGSGNDGLRRIVVPSGARVTITLRDAAITCTGDNQSPILLEPGADATIALSGTNILKAGNYRAGIGATDATLILGGVGSLTATGGVSAAGIGGGRYGAGGTVTITSGIVRAIGGLDGAGIGGGSYGAGGSVTINGETVEAIAGDGTSTVKPMAIGKGSEGSGAGTLTVDYFLGDYTWLYNTTNSAGGAMPGSGELSTEKNLDTYQYLMITGGILQKLSFPSAAITAAYGDPPITNQAAVNSSMNGGAITYRSGNITVATVDENTGEVTIVGLGSVFIYAKAAAVPGVWAATEISYTLTVNKPALDGAPAIDNTSPRYGDRLSAENGTLAANPGGADIMGTLSYQWNRGGTPIPGEIQSTYTVVQADIGQTITVTVTAANCGGSRESAATNPVGKANGPAAPTAAGSYTGNGTTFTYTVTSITGAQYSKDGSTWQDSNVFTGFTTASLPTTFYARIKATNTHEAGAAGNTGAVTFAKLNDRAAPPLSYTVSADNATISITAVTGAEYSFDGGATWGANNSKSGYMGTETVNIQIRLAATDTHNPSPPNSVRVDLSKQNQPAPSLTYTAVAGENSITLTLAPSGGESGDYAYSLDGGAFTDLTAPIHLTRPGETISVAVRDKGNSGYNPSPAATLSITLPKYTNNAAVSMTAANFSKTRTAITMITAPTASNGGAMEVSFDNGAWLPLGTGNLPSWTGLFAGNGYSIRVRAAGDATREPGAPTTVTITTDQPPEQTYTITVQNDGKGAANANVNSAAQGAAITLTATPNSGYRFKEWQVVSGGAVISGNSFTMPAAHVTVKAIFEVIPVNPDPGPDPGPDPSEPTYTHRTLTDPSGVRVSGSFTDDAALEVKEMLVHPDGTCDVCDDIRERQNKGELIVLFDISLNSGKYKGDLDVEIPVGEQYNGQSAIMLHCKDKVLESRTITVSGGMAKGTFTGLSPYAVAKVPTKTVITGLPESYTLLVGKSVSWTPAPMGGSWSYDTDLLEMTRHGDTYTFKALKTGKATATYTVDGVPHTVTITINSATIPQTGDTSQVWLWALLMPTALGGIGGLLACRKFGYKKRHG